MVDVRIPLHSTHSTHATRIPVGRIQTCSATNKHRAPQLKALYARNRTHPNMLRCFPPRAPEPVPKDYGTGGMLGMAFAGLGPAGAAVFTNPFDVAKV